MGSHSGAERLNEEYRSDRHNAESRGERTSAEQSRAVITRFTATDRQKDGSAAPIIPRHLRWQSAFGCHRTNLLKHRLEISHQRLALIASVFLLVGLSTSSSNIRSANTQAPPSRAPFSLEIPQLNQSGITSLEVPIHTTSIHTLKIHVAEPFAGKIEYNAIYTIINAESANTIQRTGSTLNGKVVTLDLEKKERFRLRPGKNVVEIEAKDNMGSPYYASFVLVAGSAENTRSERGRQPKITYQFGGQKLALVVGVSRYKFHEGGLNDLRYADKDARGVAELLAREGFKKENVSFLQNENATLENVRAAVELFLRKARENDLVFVFIASHGAQDPFDRKNIYIILHDSRVSDLPRTALNMSDLQDLFTNRLRARQMVILIDACHSAAAGGGIAATSKRQLERAENNTFNLYAEAIFNQEGRALLTSSDVNEISEEDAKWGGGHGVFTWALLRGLNGEANTNGDGVITTGELFDFVSHRVRQETDGRQNPRALPGTNRDFPLARAMK